MTSDTSDYWSEIKAIEKTPGGSEETAVSNRMTAKHDAKATQRAALHLANLLVFLLCLLNFYST